MMARAFHGKKTTVYHMVRVFSQSILCLGGLGVAHLLFNVRDVSRPMFDRHKRQVAWDPARGSGYLWANIDLGDRLDRRNDQTGM